jgi:putative acetyltransferase
MGIAEGQRTIYFSGAIRVSGRGDSSNTLNRVIIRAENPFAEECVALLTQLRVELLEKYPEELEGIDFNPEELTTAGAAFLVARVEGQAVGCGALRGLESGVAEVKRMFVVPDARGRGVGRKILEQLESVAGELGYKAMRLETGLKQPEAIALYESTGYLRVPCYGQYFDNPLSVCFEKRLQ